MTSRGIIIGKNLFESEAMTLNPRILRDAITNYMKRHDHDCVLSSQWSCQLIGDLSHYVYQPSTLSLSYRYIDLQLSVTSFNLNVQFLTVAVATAVVEH